MAIDPKPSEQIIGLLRGMHSRNELILSPKFQRRPVWPPAARSFFIDSLLNGFPVPPIHVRVTRAPGQQQAILEVVDGQQRLLAVFDFLDGRLRLSRTLNAEWAGKKFAQLGEELQSKILDRTLTIFQYTGISDREVLQIFERFNANSIQLNNQELRNGRYFGFFKQSSYDLAREYLDYWRDAHIFTDQSIARMLEVEFVSELLILQMAGLQDKKKSINDFYDRLDEDWPERETQEARFRAVMDSIVSIFGNDITGTAFTKRPLFYTLFGAIYHYVYGIPDFDDVHTKGGELDAEAEERLSVTVDYWTEVLSVASETEDAFSDTEELADVSDHPTSGETAGLIEESNAETDSGSSRLTQQELNFKIASTSQTDNVIPRRTRLELFYRKWLSES